MNDVFYVERSFAGDGNGNTIVISASIKCRRHIPYFIANQIKLTKVEDAELLCDHLNQAYQAGFNEGEKI